MLHPFSRIFGLGDKSDSTETENDAHQDEVLNLRVQDIVPNQYQPRTVFQEDKIKELAQTIRTHGIIQPIVVRKNSEGSYELIAGERRWRAVQSLEWETVPAIIREMSDTETASVAFIRKSEA